MSREYSPIITLVREQKCICHGRVDYSFAELEEPRCTYAFTSMF